MFDAFFQETAHYYSDIIQPILKSNEFIFSEIEKRRKYPELVLSEIAGSLMQRDIIKHTLYGMEIPVFRALNLNCMTEGIF